MPEHHRPAPPASTTPTVFLVGANGQVGTAIRTGEVVPDRLRPLTSSDIDISDPGSVATALADLAPGDVVLNCAAYTDVDGAEDDVRRAAAVNSEGPENLARRTAEVGAWLIHVSTDYVFAGAAATAAGPRRSQPYEPDDISRSTPPETVYGATKLAGEREALRTHPATTVVRTAWVYTGGPESRDFVGTMRRLERQRDELSVVDDQVGSPTYARDLAAGLGELIRAGGHRSLGGTILHATNGGRATWFDVARATFAEIGADPERVRPCTTAEFPRPAPRPAFSVLSPASWESAGLTPLRDWREALHAAIEAAPGASERDTDR